MVKRRVVIGLALALPLLLTVIAAPGREVIAAESVAIDRTWNELDYLKSDQIRIIIDGKPLGLDVDPQVINGRTMVPMRSIFESFGMTVTWDEGKGTVLGTGQDTTVLFTIGANRAMVNGQEKILEVPVTTIAGRTMIPLRFLSEILGYKVVWVGESNLILISRRDIVEWRYAGFESNPPYQEYEAKYINGVRTSETRYTGKNHVVQVITLYSEDGRIIPGVPDFDLARYGTGWYRQSPWSGQTYWIDIDQILKVSSGQAFFEPDRLTSLDPKILRDSAPTGNYLKIKVEDHYFSLDTWHKIQAGSASWLSGVQDEVFLAGKEIPNAETICRVTINDRFPAVILSGNLFSTVVRPDSHKVYDILDKDPRTVFPWDDPTWTRLKGENPWAGMSQDMLLVQKLSRPEQVTKTTTRFTVFELWIYEYEYSDQVYFFDNKLLAAMW